MSRELILSITVLSFLLLGFKSRPAKLDIKAPSVQTDCSFDSSAINWLTWEEAVELQKIEKRKILVDIYTDWCGWCKRMEKTTFSDDSIAAYVNENYYPIKFNAEQKEPIKLGDKVYNFVKKANQKGRDHHELALALTMGRLSYPSTVFLTEDFQVIQPIPGYKDAKEFEVIMTYFGGNFHLTTPWQKYQDNYVPLKKRK